MRGVVVMAVAAMMIGVGLSYGVAWKIEAWAERRPLAMKKAEVQNAAAMDVPKEWPISPASWGFPANTPATTRPPESASFIRSVGREVRDFQVLEDPIMQGLVEHRLGWPAHSAVRYERLWWHVRDFPSIPSPVAGVWNGGAQAPAWASPMGLRKGLRLAVRPIWSGLAVNAVVYGAMVLPGLLGLRAGWRAAARKRLAGTCTACGYPRGVSEICTECGMKVGA